MRCGPTAYFLSDPDIVIWFDVFSVNQHVEVDLDFEWWSHSFKLQNINLIEKRQFEVAPILSIKTAGFRVCWCTAMKYFIISNMLSRRIVFFVCILLSGYNSLTQRL